MADQDVDVKDLALLTGAVVFSGLAAFFGITGPAVAVLGTTAAAQGLNLADRLRQQKDRRNTERFTRLFQLLQERVQNLEEQVYSEEQVDLFLSVTRSALEDDEHNKEPFYVAVLEWIIKEKPPATHVRILSGAVKQLSHSELYCFLAEREGDSRQSVTEETVLWNRLTGAGLSYSGTSRLNPNSTRIGDILAKYCEFHELNKPDGWIDDTIGLDRCSTPPSRTPSAADPPRTPQPRCSTPPWS